MICWTRIGSADVPVRGNYASLVTFRSGEHGRKEAGEFAFWTAVLSKPVKFDKPSDIGSPKKVKTVRRITGRAQVGYSAGDRFDRMRREMRTAKDPEDRKAYKRMWHEALKQGKNIAFIRPSTKREIKRWMKAHKSDSPHASKTARIGAKAVSWAR